LNPTLLHRHKQGDSESQNGRIRADDCPQTQCMKAFPSAIMLMQKSALTQYLSPGGPYPHPKTLEFMRSAGPTVFRQRSLYHSAPPPPMPAIHPSLPKSMGIALQSVTIAGRIGHLANTPSSYGPTSRFLSLHWPGRRAGCYFSNRKMLLKDVGARRLRPSQPPSSTSTSACLLYRGRRDAGFHARCRRHPTPMPLGFDRG